MDFLIGLFLLVVLLVIVLPILSWRHALAAERAVKALAARIAALEAHLATLAAEGTPREGATREGATVAASRTPLPEVDLGAAGLADARDVQIAGPGRPAGTPGATAVKAAEPGAASTLEAQIGARWLLYFGVGAIVLGASYFLKYAFDNAWINETGRVLVGGAIGAVIIYTGIRFIRSGYAFYGQILTGGGVAILYLSAYSAYNYYHLLERPAAFGLMVAITALAAGLADRERSEGLALVAVTGGFLTPALVGGDVDAQIALFTYAAVLVAGTMCLAHRRAWPWLNLISLAFTIVTIATWAERFSTPAKYLLTEAFLTLFCAMFIAIGRANRRSTHPAAPQIGTLLNAVPGLYHVASLVVLFEHSLALLVYLIASSLAAMLAVGRGGSAGRRLIVWAAVSLPFFGWLSDHTGALWRGPAAATLLAIYSMHLLAQLDVAARDRVRPTRADVLLLHANGFGLFAGGYALIEAWSLAMGPVWAATLALWNGALARWLWSSNRATALHFVALGSVLAATAVGLEFDGAWITIGWAAEGAALLWLAVREERGWMRAGALALLGVAALRVFDLHVSDTPAGYAVAFNARVGSTLAVIGMFYYAALVRKRGRGSQTRSAALEIAGLVVIANILTLTMLSTEIRAYWDLRHAGRWADLAEGMMLSVTWAAYAVALIVEGIRRRYAPIRYLAIAVLGVTIVKVLVVDLAELDKVYRILSVVIVGMLLLLASYLYQRYSHSIADAPDPGPQLETK